NKSREQQEDNRDNERSGQKIATDVGRSADAPGIKWIEPRFELIGGAVTELGQSQKVDRVPLVPDFQPRPAERNIFFFKSMIARGTKREEQDLDGQGPADYEPILARQPTCDPH